MLKFLQTEKSPPLDKFGTELWAAARHKSIQLTDMSLEKCYAFILSCWNIYRFLFISVFKYFILFFVSQGAVIEAYTRGVYFVHLFNGEKKNSKVKRIVNL